MFRDNTIVRDMKEIKDFKNKRVLIIGLGLSGVAAAKLLSDFKADVRITDSRDELDLVENIMQLPDGVTIETGRHSSVMIDGVDMIVVSPGVSPDNPIITKAQGRNIPIISEIELAYRFTANIPWIAVTGTNGKSTTTTLIDLMLRRAGYNIITGGNIGMPLSSAIKDYHSSNSKKRVDYIVSEISSFQLETIKTFRPHISIILNITPDHLDRYRDMSEYIEAKKNVLKNMTKEDMLILNFEDPVVKGFEGETRARIYFFSGRHSHDGISAFLKEDNIYINGQEIISVNDMALKGAHNIENVMAATLTSMLAGADLKSIKDVLINFSGLEHRLEYVDTIESVEFYNDSKGTNIGAVIKSLESFNHSVVLILGGKDKGSDFKDLIPYIKERVKAVIAIGECKEKIVNQLMDETQVIKAEDMRDAVNKGFNLAKPSGVVLLSPGCASFDMFENFEHRGQVFKEEVYRIRKR
jgi:UDP-N-acetylmuramoylalanine--D-glutamate ligase